MERFDHYMERCLYGPAGFYHSSGAGRRDGDFITSPEVGPLFGAVLARWLDQQWIDLGRPDPFTVIDAGTGPGTLLRSIAMAEPQCAESIRSLGVDPYSKPSQAGTEHWQLLPELPADLRGAVVIANELLDNLPFRIVGHQGPQRDPAGPEWFERFVVGESAAPQWQDEPTDPPGLDLPVGTTAPLLEAAHDWVAAVMSRGAARLLVFDYGLASTAELAERGGWLRTYRQHERGHNPLADPGERDITCDIAADQLPPNNGLCSQAEFLTRWGIEQLVEQGRTHWQANVHAPDVAAFAMASRVPEAEALLDSAGLGSWLALEWWRED